MSQILLPLALLGAVGAVRRRNRRDGPESAAQPSTRQRSQPHVPAQPVPAPSAPVGPPEGQLAMRPTGMPSFMGSDYNYIWDQLAQGAQRRYDQAFPTPQSVPRVTPPARDAATGTQDKRASMPVNVGPQDQWRYGTNVSYNNASNSQPAGSSATYSNASASSPGSPYYVGSATDWMRTPYHASQIESERNQGPLGGLRQTLTDPVLSTLLVGSAALGMGGLGGASKFMDAWLPNVLGIGQAETDQRQLQEAREASNRQAARGELMYQSVSDMLPYAHQALRGQAGGQFDTLDATQKSAYDAYAPGVQGRYDQRTSDVMGLLEGQGTQARRDIAETARKNLSATQQQLARSGFGGGQFTQAAQQGAQREQSDALGRLNEALAAQKADAYMKTSGDAAMAAQRLGALNYDDRMNLAQQRATTNLGMMQDEWNQELQNLYNIIGWIGGVEHMYPQMMGVNNLIQSASSSNASRRAQQAAQEQADAMMTGSIIGGIGNIGGSLLGNPSLFKR